MPRVRPNPIPVLSDSDLTPSARIRNAALELFATRGVEGTTIRNVAEAAAVSPGLVQHHFSTKAGLRRAVNDFVLALAAESFAEFPDAADGTDPIAELGNRITAIARQHPMAMLYVARAVSEEDEAALDVFAAVVEIAREQLRRLGRRKVLHPGLDLDWEALHVLVFSLGSLLFAPAVDRVLDEPFLTDEGLDRWNAAATKHFRRALAQAPAEPRRARARR